MPTTGDPKKKFIRKETHLKTNTFCFSRYFKHDPITKNSKSNENFCLCDILKNILDYF